MREATLTVTHRSGLHARPAAVLVQTARGFVSAVTISAGDRSALGTSILGVLGLGVGQGSQVTIRVEGEDEDEALRAISRLIGSNFGEVAANTVRGLPSSPGIAIGPVYRCCRSELDHERTQVTDAGLEQRRFREALEGAREQLLTVHAGVRDSFGAGHAAIFGAQALMLEDPELVRTVLEAIQFQGTNAECALLDAAEAYATRLERLDDPYLRVRAADVRDVADRLTRVLLGLDESPFAGLRVPSVIVARDVAPSDMALLDKSMALGFVTAEGGPTSHTAILARALGLPAAVGAGSYVLAIPEGTIVVLDGAEGAVIVDPDERTLSGYRRLQSAIGHALAEARSHAHEPATTLEGQPVEILANVGAIPEASAAVQAGAAGIGLLRTEFLYLGRKQMPDEEEQVRAYTAVFEAVGDLPVVLRTLDLGSDKEVPYLSLPREANPFLGLRGIRLGLARPELVRPQLRAVLRAGVGRNVRLLLPLVTTVGEVVALRRVLEECRSELLYEGYAVNENIPLGAMIEVPAAALMIDRLAEHVDFFSIGTNDLSQYLMAADRTNAAVAPLVNGLQPALLRLVGTIIADAHAAGKRVGLCGELAGDPAAIPILLGLGLDDFSMSPPAVPLAKQILRTLTLPLAEEIARAALGLGGPDEVLALVHDRVPATRVRMAFGQKGTM